MAKSKCERCIAYSPNPAMQDTGQCRLRAPQIKDPPWPEVYAADWCCKFFCANCLQPICICDQKAQDSIFHSFVAELRPHFLSLMLERRPS